MTTEDTEATETFEAETDDINVTIDLEEPTKTGVIIGVVAAAAVIPTVYVVGRKLIRVGRDKYADRKAKKNPAATSVIETTGSETKQELDPESE